MEENGEIVIHVWNVCIFDVEVFLCVVTIWRIYMGFGFVSIARDKISLYLTEILNHRNVLLLKPLVLRADTYI